MDAYISHLSQVENDKGTIKVRHELVSTTNNILNGQYVPGRNETIVEPQLQRIIFLNPLGETNLQERMVLSNWRKYTRQLEMLHPEYGQINWTLHIPDHSKQQDGSSCGIYCLMFAEKHLQGSSLEGITQAEANWERKKVANTLMKTL
ncbi:uncharacterized protein [Mytilus edulis]|uniref:uncharacterized protein n=1 Tax=Mytilus edulis TaxID=6550 RepID=UPI0039F0B628